MGRHKGALEMTGGRWCFLQLTASNEIMEPIGLHFLERSLGFSQSSRSLARIHTISLQLQELQLQFGFSCRGALTLETW